MPQPETVKILVVDDVEKNLIAMDALLRRDGVEILKAPSGPAALELLLLRHDVALALLDVQMPGMDGHELAELMRGTERTRRVPIIFVTAVATDERRRFRGYRGGRSRLSVQTGRPADRAQQGRHLRRASRASGWRSPASATSWPPRSAGSRRIATTARSPSSNSMPNSGVIGCWSNGAERLFGWSAAEVLGRRAAKLDWLDPANGEAVEAVLGQMAGWRGTSCAASETFRCAPTTRAGHCSTANAIARRCSKATGWFRSACRFSA